MSLQTWGTDGSMLPVGASVLDRKSVTTTLTSANTLVLKLEGRNISILHGELVRLITCLIISDADNRNAVLYTNHLNSVRLVDNSKTAVDQQTGLHYMTRKSYYRWILALVSKSTDKHGICPPMKSSLFRIFVTRHVPGYTPEVSVLRFPSSWQGRNH
jgi:hypothetical protein